MVKATARKPQAGTDILKFKIRQFLKEEEAQKAIRELNGTMLDGRTLTVNEARPRENRGGGGGGGRGRGGYGRR